MNNEILEKRREIYKLQLDATADALAALDSLEDLNLSEFEDGTVLRWRRTNSRYYVYAFKLDNRWKVSTYPSSVFNSAELYLRLVQDQNFTGKIEVVSQWSAL